MSVKSLAALFGMVAVLSACGGGSDSPSPAPTAGPAPAPSPGAPVPAPAPNPGAPAPAPGAPAPEPAPAPAPGAAPGGLYVGYYQEDPASNPEDPVPGAFSLNLPTGNDAFSGSMYFTYVGCQSSNVGTVSGTKTDAALSGNWSGTVDNLPQTGAYTGTFDTATQSYSGTYTNAGGKQYVNLQPCIDYYIAPNGTWEMFPIESNVPAGFSVAVQGRTISWSSTPGAGLTLVYVLDQAIAQSTGNPVVWQTVVTPTSNGLSVTVPSSVTLTSGKTYVAAVGIGDDEARRLAFGSKRFTP